MKHSVKKALFVLTFVFSAYIASAQPATMESVCKFLENHPITTGNFVQEKKSAGSSRVLKSSGTFVLSRTALGLRNTKPVKSFRGLTPEYMVRITPDGAKTFVDGSSNDIFKSISDLVGALFDCNIAEIEKAFTVQFNASATEWDVKLLPKDKTIASVLSAIEVHGTGNASDCVINTLSIIDEKGGSVKYIMTDLVYKKELSSDEKALFAKK